MRRKDKVGKPTANKDDTYIPAKNGVEIYRYNVDTLEVSFNTILYARNRIQEMKDAGVELKLFQSGDDESVYLFPASDLDKAAEIVKARKRIVLTEEEKTRRRLHMETVYKKHKKTHTKTKYNATQ